MTAQVSLPSVFGRAHRLCAAGGRCSRAGGCAAIGERGRCNVTDEDTEHRKLATSLPAASGGVKGKRSVRRGLQKTSLFQQAMFSQGTTSGKVDVHHVHIPKSKSSTFSSGAFVFALLIFPASRPASIVSVHELNFCVRDGNRWTLMTINTNSLWMALAIVYINALLSDDLLVTHTGFEPMLTA